MPSALVAALSWGPAALAATGGPTVAKVLTSCGFTALKTAVAAGGTIDYGVNCTSPAVSFTATIKVPAGLTADVEANGHSVTFDGGGKVRLFQVTGGKLTIGGISLNNAAVSTASGTNGGTGAERDARDGREQRRQRDRPARLPAKRAARARRAARAARPRRARPAVPARTPPWPAARRC